MASENEYHQFLKNNNPKTIIGDDPTNPDIEAFKNALNNNLTIFLKAREEHGNHLDNPEWYDRAELACKCWRYIKLFQKGELPELEEIIDLANYAIMIVSRQKQIIRE